MIDVKKTILLFLIACSIAYSDESKYVPMCFEKHCRDVPNNIAYIGTGKGNLNGFNQAIYSFGYMRRIETKIHESLYLGIEVLGSDKDSIYGTIFKLGMGF